MLTFNIIGTCILAISVTWVGLFVVCNFVPYSTVCRQNYNYFIAGAVAVFLVLMVFFWHQYDATRSFWQTRQKAMPHVISRYSIYERAAQTIWNIRNLDDKLVKSEKLSDLDDVGWIVEYKRRYPVIISQREFYYWLLDVAKLQNQLEAMGQGQSVSPMSHRNNPKLSRRRLQVYTHLLEEVNAIEYLNANVKRLKPTYAADVWVKIIKPLEKIRPLVRI